MNPKISIVIPVFNVEEYIEESLKSVCNQSFADFELIIVNDGSTDQSINKAKIILQSTDIAWRIFDQSNKGQAAARNLGIRNACGEWIVCPDSDDILDVNFLSRMYGAVIKYQTVMAFSDFQYVTESNKFKSPDWDNGDRLITREELLKRFLDRRIQIIAPGVLINREFHNKYVPYDETCRFTEDLIYVWDVLFKVECAAYVQSPMYNYLRRPNSTMTSSTQNRIMSGYQAFNRLESRLAEAHPDQNKVIDFILPRWIIGALRSASAIYCYNEFSDLCEKMKSRNYIKKLLHFPDIKVKILAVLFLTSNKLFYSFIRTAGGK